MELTVDGRTVQAREGRTVLEACLENDIYVPNLCFLKGMENPPASCRLCFVEIEGRPRPVSSCKVEARPGMVVRTDTEAVKKLQLSGFQLLMSCHHLHPHCPAERGCDMWRIARHLGVKIKQKRLDYIRRDPPPPQDHPFLCYDYRRCVLCGRCVYVCRRKHGISLLNFAGRGFDTVVSTYGWEDVENPPCGECRACVEVCPTAAIFFKAEFPKAVHC